MTFAAQTSIADTQDRGYAGMLAYSGPKQIDPMKAASRREVSIALTAANTTHYITTITQNGAAVAYDYTSDGSATTAEIAAGLLALINAGTQSVVASGTDTPLIVKATGDGPLGDFSIAYNGNMVETVVQTGNMSIPYGAFVCKDDLSDERVCRLPNVAADVTGLRARGFVVADNFTRVSAGKVPANAMANVLRKGFMLVTVEEAVKDGDPVYIRYAAGGNGIGAARKSTGSTEAALLAGAVFRSDQTAANGLAVVEVNLPA